MSYSDIFSLDLQKVL
uniref:Uncharacterized protein n=1 Tax=Arundo donax TaxID=35708 RepID=A0A0A9C3P6_ARUDO